MSGASTTGRRREIWPALLSVFLLSALALSPLALRYAWLGGHAHHNQHSSQPLQNHDGNHAFCLKCVLLTTLPTSAARVPAWQPLLLVQLAPYLVKPPLRLGYRMGARAPPALAYTF